jgi:hypothetical protein
MDELQRGRTCALLLLVVWMTLLLYHYIARAERRSSPSMKIYFVSVDIPP